MERGTLWLSALVAFLLCFATPGRSKEGFSGGGEDMQMFKVDKSILGENFDLKNMDPKNFAKNIDLGKLKKIVPNDGDFEDDGDVEGNYEEVEEDGVLVLTTQNFKHFVKKKEFILVEFYAPWCTHCKQLAPVYAEAAKQLKDLKLTLAKVDVTKNEPLAKKHMVTGFPTVILFQKGKKVEEYAGDRTTEGIVNYMKVRTDPNWKPPPTSVVELNSDNFTSYMESKPLVLVLFYAEYCQHCEQIKPEFIQAANALKDYGVPCAQIDGVTYSEIANEFKVKGWPTLYVFRKGKAFPYKGTRDAKGMIEYMKEQLKSPSYVCKTQQELDNRIHRYLPTVIGVFSSKNSPFFKEFLAVANHLRQEPLKFIHTFTTSIGESLNVEAGQEAVIVRKAPVFVSKYEENEAVLADATKSGDDIAEFIRQTYRPLVGQRTKQNQALFYAVRPLVVVYYDANFNHQYQKASEITRSKVVEVAKEFPNITFAVANEEEFLPELQAVKLDDSGADVNVIWYDKNRVKYIMEPVDDFDGSDLRKFVHQANDGLLKPVWRSQPIPTKQEGPVVNVVADSFESTVLTKPGDRDVVYYIYAPWCGHCKNFDGTYKKVAKELKSDRLLFIKMDGTANDLPPGFDVRGYPTVFFIPAFKKHEPVIYDGDRSKSHFKEWVKKQTSIFLTEEEKEGRNKVEL